MKLFEWRKQCFIFMKQNKNRNNCIEQYKGSLNKTSAVIFLSRENTPPPLCRSDGYNCSLTGDKKNNGYNVRSAESFKNLFNIVSVVLPCVVPACSHRLSIMILQVFISVLCVMLQVFSKFSRLDICYKLYKFCMKLRSKLQQALHAAPEKNTIRITIFLNFFDRFEFKIIIWSAPINDTCEDCADSNFRWQWRYDSEKITFKIWYEWELFPPFY